MNRDYEALSAFLDGETSELETRRVLRDLDQADIATLGRWQLASDTLRGHASREVPPAFNARLSAALAAESKPAKRAGMMGGFARVAVAASVAGTLRTEAVTNEGRSRARRAASRTALRQLSPPST